MLPSTLGKFLANMFEEGDSSGMVLYVCSNGEIADHVLLNCPLVGDVDLWLLIVTLFGVKWVMPMTMFS